MNQVWWTDVTYIPMAHGFVYLVAIMDWCSRRVLSWRVSNTLDTSFCIEALEEALSGFGTPEIFNTDQGAQFASEAFASVVRSRGVKISMDGKGRCLDNIFVEGLWRSVKFEEVYLHAYANVAEARAELALLGLLQSRAAPPSSRLSDARCVSSWPSAGSLSLSTGCRLEYTSC